MAILVVISILSFLIVFVLGVAVKFDTAFVQDSTKEFWKYRIGRVAFVSLIISAGLLFIVQAFTSRYARHKVLDIINNPESKIYVNQVIINDSVLYEDFKRFTKTSSSRNTGNTKIWVDIKQNDKTIHLTLLRDFNHSDKYWVSSEDYGKNCFGEINTEQLNYVK
ncbi:MAG: hypothetical protein V4581_10240 [Bacteroidota bacterium]